MGRRSSERRDEALAEREFYREEVGAVLDIEEDGVRCPSTFDGGAYLRECAERWVDASRRART